MLFIDKNKGNKDAEKKYVEINNAYEVLRDASKRQQYDRFGEEGVNNNNRGGDDMEEFDPFGSMFGGGFGRPRQGERRVSDVILPLSVSLEMLYNGAIVDVAHKKRVICDSWSDCEKKCTRCGGSGVVIQTRRLGPGFVQQMQTHCPMCGGKGKIVTPNCTSCENGQFEQVEKSLLIDVEKGMKHGQKITFDGETDEAPDFNPGSVHFQIDSADHARFERRGDDLHYALWITLSEALVGVKRQVRQLDGRLVHINTDKVIGPGEKITIKGEGMPIQEDGVGDMVVEFWVRFPKSMNEEEKKEVLRLHGERPTLEESGDGLEGAEFNNKSGGGEEGKTEL